MVYWCTYKFLIYILSIIHILLFKNINTRSYNLYIKYNFFKRLKYPALRTFKTPRTHTHIVFGGVSDLKHYLLPTRVIYINTHTHTNTLSYFVIHPMYLYNTLHTTIKRLFSSVFIVNIMLHVLVKF